MKIENVAVISLEDYAEYLEFKRKKNKVDFDKLKPGSVVKVVSSGDQIAFEIDPSKKCTVVSVNSGFVFDRLGNYSKVSYRTTLNVIQGGKLASFASSDDLYCVKEVISY